MQRIKERVEVGQMREERQRAGALSYRAGSLLLGPYFGHCNK